jgi:predicted DsbA family dithiol-disulfide isomerase
MLRIEVVSDVVCPFCLIGTRRLEQALARTGTEAEITFHPFLLDPSTPKEGADLRERLRRKYGGDPNAMFARVEAFARESDIALDFSKVTKTFNTTAAHTLIRHAKAKGTQVALTKELFDAYFLRGEDLGDLDVLAKLAAAHGFSLDEARRLATDEGELATTREQAAEAVAEGIGGVPFFVFEGRLAVSGAQPVEVFERAIRQAAGAPGVVGEMP